MGQVAYIGTFSNASSSKDSGSASTSLASSLGDRLDLFRLPAAEETSALWLGGSLVCLVCLVCLVLGNLGNRSDLLVVCPLVAELDGRLVLLANLDGLGLREGFDVLGDGLVGLVGLDARLVLVVRECRVLGDVAPRAVVAGRLVSRLTRVECELRLVVCDARLESDGLDRNRLPAAEEAAALLLGRSRVGVDRRCSFRPAIRVVVRTRPLRRFGFRRIELEVGRRLWNVAPCMPVADEFAGGLRLDVLDELHGENLVFDGVFGNDLNGHGLLPAEETTALVLDRSLVGLGECRDLVVVLPLEILDRLGALPVGLMRIVGLDLGNGVGDSTTSATGSSTSSGAPKPKVCPGSSSVEAGSSGT